MSSSPSPLLKLELQASGEHPDTWGDNLNASIALIEQAIAGRSAIATTGGTTTLTDTQYATNQDRCAALDFSGVLVSNATIIVPARTKSWIVRNQCTGAFTLTVKTSAGTGVVVAQGQVATLWCDGTNVVSVSTDATTLGGFAAAAFARFSALAIFTAGFGQSFHDLADGATITIDAAVGSVFAVTLGGNRTIALTNPVDGSEVELYVTQDATGGRTLTWPANVINATSIQLASSANAATKLVLRYKNSITSWYIVSQGTVSAGGSSTIANVTVTGGGAPVDAWALAGSPAAPVTFTFTLAAGVVLQSPNRGTPALDFSGFAAGSVISFVNNGYILGAGGAGGRGATYDSDDGDSTLAQPGEAGGTALRLPSALTTFNITNNGHIWGGGGGGGGGGANNGDVSWAGGGGGGAGGGDRGPSSGLGIGGRGSIGRLGTFGAGGAGGGTVAGSVGGPGGTWATAGTAGTAGTGAGESTSSGNAGAGGTAGKAIDYNGGSTPTYVITGDILGVTS